jgi:hypothetical protein
MKIIQNEHTRTLYPSENEQNGQQEEEHDDGKNNILTMEIDSWSNFEYAQGRKQTSL